MIAPGMSQFARGPKPLEAARQQLVQIVSRLRRGDRPSLVGKIPGLNPRMEAAFRSGQYFIIEIKTGQTYAFSHSAGSDSMTPAALSIFGLSDKAKRSEIQQAYQAYAEWRRREAVFSAGDMAAAQSSFCGEFPNTRLLNTTEAGQVYHVMTLLELVPKAVLDSGAISRLDLNGERVGASRYLDYDNRSGSITMINPHFNWDRYLFTVVVLRGLGHAIFTRLTERQGLEIQSLRDSFWSERLVFGTEFWGMPKGDRIRAQETTNEFFAENFMHYIILGRSGLDKYVSNSSFCEELNRFYAGIIPPLTP